MSGAVFYLILSIFILSHTSAQNNLIIQLHDGKIQGHTLQSYNGSPYYAFQEIPYAAPPVGEDRFGEPRSPAPWNGVRDATKNINRCVQFSLLMPSTMIDSEDCLFLNVYTPQKPGSGDLLPVYLWIHGGGFLGGSGTFSDVNPARFMDYGIVVVTINYRLGALGFIGTDDDVIPGNLGLKDQAFAMKWVNSNINLFGGDPDQVTIGGASAGAMSTSSQLLGLQTSGLFRGAIQESGSAISQLGYSIRAKDNAFNLGRAVDPTFQSDKSEDLLKLLKGVSFQDLVNASMKIAPADDDSAGFVPSLLWVPVIEGPNAKNPFINSPMLESFISGNFHQVPVLMGFNSEEALSFIVFSQDGYASDYDKNITLLVDSRLNVANEDAYTVATQLKKIYTDSAFQEDQAALVKLSSDASFTTSMLRQAEESAKYVPVYFYQFSYMGLKSIYDQQHNQVPGAEGAGHGEDVTYLFDGIPPESQSDVTTMNRLLLLWTNFVKYLNPTPIPDALLDQITWTTVQNSDIQYLNINDTLKVESSPRYYSKLRSLLLDYVKPPYTVF